MSSPKTNRASKQQCPICDKETEKAYEPFCSKRCADVDLHRWLTGSYAIPAVEADESPDAESDEAETSGFRTLH